MAWYNVCFAREFLHLARLWFFQLSLFFCSLWVSLTLSHLQTLLGDSFLRVSGFHCLSIHLGSCVASKKMKPYLFCSLYPPSANFRPKFDQCKAVGILLLLEMKAPGWVLLSHTHVLKLRADSHILLKEKKPVDKVAKWLSFISFSFPPCTSPLLQACGIPHEEFWGANTYTKSGK